MSAHSTSSPGSSTSLVGLLRQRAQGRAEDPLYTFLEEDGAASGMTGGELDRWARRIGAALEAVAPAGARVVLLYPPGLQYIAGFFGCLYSQRVAVPAYPPDPLRLGRTLPRLRAIIEDARATVVLTTSFIASFAEMLFEQAPELQSLQWVATDTLPEDTGHDWTPADVGPDALAFLQYTSGSTGTPKGVMLSHGNLLHNLGLIAHAFESRQASVGVIWLPPYHDMGLIGGILQPLYAGFPVALMSPLDFLKRPLRWLEAVSRFKGTISGGPNFAFDLCVRKSTPEERAALDLSAWEVAFCGAEPIRPEVLARFTEAFAPSGFRPEALYACYGLAEATLIVSGGKKGVFPVHRSFSPGALARNEARVDTTAEGQVLVGCGGNLPDQELRVVDPATCAPCPPGTVGEIWVSGPSVARGYWQRPEETARAFEAQVPGSDRRFLRTGDLGFLHEGELFVSGRLKDLIILRGRNIHPQDLELTVEQSHPALRPGCTAAFALEVDGEERLVVVQEVDVRKLVDPAEVTALVRRRLAEQHDVQLHALALIEPGSIPKTSSGKIQRNGTRAAFVAGELALVSTWREEAAVGATAPEAVALSSSATLEETTTWLRDTLGRRLRVRAEELDPAVPITRFGFDSLVAIELGHALEIATGVSLRMEELLRGPSVMELAALLHGRRSAAKAALPAITRRADDTPPLLSPGQERLWLLEQLQPGGALYNLAVAVRFKGALDTGALERAFQDIVRRHEVLRTTFRAVETEGPAVLIVSPDADFTLATDDLRARPAAEREREVQRRADAEALRPFLLTQGPLLRGLLLRTGEQEHVLVLTMHHIVSDGASMEVLVRELAALYAAHTSGQPAALPELPLRYSDYGAWLREHLRGETLERLLGYWRRQLEGAPEVLELGVARPRPAVSTHQGDSVEVKLSALLMEQVKSLAREQGVSPFVVLLAAFQLLLARYSGQDDICVGTPINGRDRPETQGLIGFFVNTLVLRTRLAGAATFHELLARVRDVTLEAYAHQELPFEKLVEALRPTRHLGASPLFQVVLAILPDPLSAQPLPGLELQQLELPSRLVQSDLRLALAESVQGLHGRLEYSTDLFDAATARQLVKHLGALLEAAVSQPSAPLASLSPLDEAERRQLLVEWSGVVPGEPEDVCAHRLFEAQVARTPDAVALSFEGEELSYRELNARANRLARVLRHRGVGPEVLVGLCVERSFEMVVGLLAILKAGGAYVPIDPSQPMERLALILDDTRAPLVLTRRALVDRLGGQQARALCLEDVEAEVRLESAEDLDAGATGDNLAYVIYTSGSTGRPKGTLLQHRGLCNTARQTLAVMKLEVGSRLLQFFALSFDAAVSDIFPPLLSGATLVLVPRERLMPGAPLEQTLNEQAITVVTLTPSVLAQLFPAGVTSLRTVLTAGEACTPEIALRWADRLRFVNAYGPTEVTVCATFNTAMDPERPTLGRPMANVQVYVLDDALQPVPAGVPGELYVAGVGLARGYLGRPDLTAERFIPHPYSAVPGARLYRTGDRVRHLADGDLEYVGRVDDQVKLRGYRIEPGEIEAALRAQPGVRDAAVIVREDVAGDPRLVAYVVASLEVARGLRGAIESRLPEYMVPSAFIPLEALPLTHHGKLNRKALPPPEDPRLTLGEEYAAPTTDTEHKLVAIWAEVLRTDRIGIHDDFFDLGGHSLMATQVISRIRTAFGVDLPLTALMTDATTVAVMARRIDASAQQPRRAPPPLARVPRTGPLPLSLAQERLWLADQLSPGSPLYNVPAAVRMRGMLHVPALERGLAELIRRHEALRTVFREVDGRPVQVILPPGELALPVEDLGGRSREEAETEARRLAREEAVRPFDLAHGPLVRTVLVRLGEDEHILCLTLHHIVSDGWSGGVFLRELAALYGAFSQGGPSPLAELPIQYADYAAWHRGWLESGVLAENLAWWRGQLTELPTLQLRTDTPRPPGERFRGDSRRFTFPAELTARLESLARGEGATLFMALLAVFDVLLHHHTGQDDIVVGTDIASREHDALEGIIGFFTNQLVLRTPLSGQPTFQELLSRVRRVALEAYEHQDTPFGRLVQELRDQRAATGQPLFQAKLVLENAPMPAMRLPGLALELMEGASNGLARWDLLLILTPDREGLSVVAEYNTDVLDGEGMARLWEHFLLLAHAAVEAPGQRISTLPMLTREEHQRLAAWNGPSRHIAPDACIPACFEQRVSAAPDAVALVFQEQTLTYGELNRRANQLAHHLRGLGVGPGSRVALALERSLELVIGMVAILKAGGAYVPLDASYPAERLSFLLEEARPAAIVTRSEVADELPAHWAQIVCMDRDEATLGQKPEHDLAHEVGPESEAYVLFTSGSTGTPKGVAVPHRGVLRLVQEPGYVRLSSEETLLQLAPLAFDASTFEVWGALLNGARLVIAPPHAPSLDELGGLISRERITTVWLTAGLFHQVVDTHLGALAPVRQLLAGGDVLSAPHVARVLETYPTCRVINGYGPTENTTFTCCFPVTDREELRAGVPLGRPVPGTRVYVLNPALAQVPIGAPGELYAAGDGLAHGYLHQPALTAERFIPDPFGTTPGARLYRTGDLCRVRRDGTLEFLGRVDNQVKVRGFRIEPGEVETAVRRHPAVRDTVVVAREFAGEKSLVAYVVPVEGQTVTVDGMRSFLSDKLPAHMVPAAVVTLAELPLTANGKVDRRALPAPDGARPELGTTYVAPRTPAEEILAVVGAETLGVKTVGIDDSFFDLGGDSIRAIQYVARCRERGVELSVATLLEKQTVRAMAETLLHQEPPRTAAAASQLFSLVSSEDRARLPADVMDAYPLAALQVGMLFQSEYSQQSALYHDAFSFHLELEDASAEPLRHVLQELASRHPVLRTSFDLVRFSVPLQLVHREAEVPLHVEDLGHLSRAEQDTVLREWLGRERSRPFAWDRAPLLRFGFHRRGEHTVQLSVIFHHAILDGWSFASLLTELVPRYLAVRRGAAAPVPPLEAVYREFVALERQALDSEETQRYWQERLAEVSRVRVDAARRTGAQAPGPLLFREFPLTEHLARGLRALAHQAVVPIKSVLLAAHLRVRGVLEGASEVVTGFVVNGRPEVSDGERVLGLFLNSVPFPVRLGGGSWVELVREVFAREQALSPHRRYPMARMQQQLGGRPLFDALFNFVHFHVSEGLTRIPGMRLVEPYWETSWLDMPLDTTFSVDPETQDVKLTLRSHGREWDLDRLEYIAGIYLRALEDMALRPLGRYESCQLLDAQERHRLLVSWNDTATQAPPAKHVGALFEAQVQRTPDAVALQVDALSLSYRELNARANQLARVLRRNGVKQEVRVALALQRGLDMVVGVLGVLKAGGTYVPLDPSYPYERLAYVLKDSAAQVLVAHSILRDELPDTGGPQVCLDEIDLSPEEDTDLGVTVDADQLAYVLYTSGSTGRPKGVMVTHGGAVNYLVWSREAYDAASGAGAPVHSPLGFDLTITSLLTPLMAGGRVVLVPDTKAGEGLAQVLRSGTDLSLVKLTPTQLSLLETQLGDVAVAGRVRCFVVGGEALTSAALAFWRERAPATRIINEYGPTETVVGCCTFEVGPQTALGSTVPIGRPIANTKLYVLDAHLMPVAVGVPGELYIGGAGVARGYSQQPALTAERFVPDSFSSTPGQRLYRTGDLVRWRADGELDFLGRIDDQVKVRGFRIELGEIEAVLAEHSAVKEVAVAVRDDSGDRKLIAYVVAHDAPPNSLELRGWLLTRLPEPMVPSEFLTLDALPLTPNGKVDRKALPDMEVKAVTDGMTYAAPRTPVEERIAEILAMVLGRPRVGRDDDFFALGGHSLTATQAIVRVRDAFRIDLPVGALFDAPTVGALAEQVERTFDAGAGVRWTPLVRVPRDGTLPLSFAQQRLWFMDQLEPGSAAYNIPAAVSIEGDLDAASLERAFAALVARHEPLRTAFRAENGQPVQVISPVGELPLRRVDLRGLPVTERDAEERRLKAEEARTPFDLQRGPLLRTVLIQQDERAYTLLVTLHHIISDGWSTGVLIREMAALYEAFSGGKPSPLKELDYQYADFAAWQRRWMDGPELEAEIDFWRMTLAGAPPLLELPTDRPRPPVRAYRGATHAVALPRQLSESIKALSQKEGATPFMVLLAAFQTLLARTSGQDDLCVGTPVAGRTRTEVEGLIGFFVNTLVLRTSVAGDPSFLELLGRVREVTLAAYTHQDVPLDKLVEQLHPERSLSHPPLFQVVFALQNAPTAELTLPGLVLRALPTESQAAKFDLALSLREGPDGFDGFIEYDTDLFDAETISRMEDQLRVLLQGVVSEPRARLSRLALTHTSGLPSLEPQPAPVHPSVLSLIAGQASRAPEAPAVIDGERVFTYGELVREASRLAHRLARMDSHGTHPIAVLLERSAEMVMAQLAILKAGSAFMPLDPTMPDARLRVILAEPHAAVVVTSPSLAARLPPGLQVVFANIHPSDADRGADEGTTEPPEPLPSQSAYVIFTSGTTGVPKGITTDHAALAHLTAWHQRDLPTGPGDRGAVMASPAFDASMLELWPKLAAGATLVIVPDEVRAAPAALARWMADTAITTAFFTTALGELVLAEPLPAHHRVRVIVVGGEQLRRRPTAETPYQLLNVYGPTEVTVLATCDFVAPASVEQGLPTIGRAISGARVYVLDAHLRPVPVGTPGELFIAGGGLARGYLGRPDLTAERFLPDPLGPPGSRMYRSGDRTRMRADGRLEFLGRLDGQVKLRGFRIELGEIEAALGAHPAIKEAVVTVHEVAEDRRLVGYVVGRQELPEAAELRRWLLERLPEYMVPAAFIRLEAMPLDSNGKVVRKALPAPDALFAGSTEGYVPPRTPTEEILTGLFSRVLGVERVGIKDGFFDLGGHSLLATQLVSRLRAAFGVELPLRVLFESATPEHLAERVEALARKEGGPPVPPLTRMPRGERLPLSFAQQRLWFLDRLEPGSALYNLSHAMRLSGHLDVEALEHGLAEVVRRHDSLRTTFGMNEGLPYQIVASEVPSVLERIRMEGTPEEREEAVLRRCAAEVRRPFDLARGPLIRAVLLELSEDTHVLMMTMHHIISDGWSVGVFVREMAALYESFRQERPSPLAPLPIQYVDYAIWQRQWLEGEVLTAQLGYWKDQLAGAPRALDLPTDRARPPVQTYSGASHRIRWSPELSARVKAVSRQEGVTPFMTLLAAFQSLLSRYSGQDDICVGSPIAGRTREETEQLVGFFVNTLVLRTSLAGDPSFRELLARVRNGTLGAYAHQDVPFEKVVEALQPERDLSRSPLFQVMFALQNTAVPALALPELKVTPLEPDLPTARFELILTLMEEDGALTGAIEYNTRLFDGATIRRMEVHLVGLLQAVLEDVDRQPSRVPLLSDVERRHVLVDWNATEAVLPSGCAHELVAAQSARTPDALAVTFQDQRVTYRELERRANQLAHRMRALGVGPEVQVGLCVDRSVELVVGILAVLKAGGAYVPLDPGYPRERLAFMLADSGVRVLLVQRHLADGVAAPGVTVHVLEPGVGEGAPETPPDVAVDADNLAYVIYTSGSTGRPKGTLLTHRGLSNTALAAVKEHGFHPGSRVLQFAATSFDASVCEIFATLLAGATLCLAPREALLPGPPLRAVLTDNAITAVTLTPSVLAQLEPEGLPALETVISAGEACTPDVARRWSRGRRLLNAYGPTEVTICASINGAVDPERPTLGRPFPNVRVYVLDARLVPAPVGVAGELYVGGPGVARGYTGRPDLTAERFVPDPFGTVPGARLYRTGDVVRWCADGELEYVGRADGQVKLRGFRIELGELEAVLREHPAVRDAAVVARDEGGTRRLVAYVTGDGPGLEVPGLRGYLTERLPLYMVPATFVVLDTLPLSSSGKLDRKALPPPDARHLGSAATYEAPRSDVERTVAGIWQEVLNVPRVGLHDGFFDLGGNSLSLVQIHGKLQSALGVEFPLVELFQHQSVSALAAHLRRVAEAAATPVDTAAEEERFDSRRALLERQQARRRGRAGPTQADSDGNPEDSHE
ncbi:non-ribosomal peptide synthase/polyketide synthase [Myxococcus sp. CA039A]|uniref:non-ribosomal peptide synthase/polyketide synthase n=1 Tax=Myxococcus sp. CA039A TaxID=2741737 RepID=UPI00157AB287|nr:non-ribosomal peptide synthase/polyketide synthase [Myxococcus sp. CA039A]NTX50273.1 non-ribosomal peptide synthase/polyketide synthase [Myxococcus sp. CA039A]